MACGILVSGPGIESGTLAVRAQSLNHWTTREFPHRFFLDGGGAQEIKEGRKIGFGVYIYQMGGLCPLRAPALISREFPGPGVPFVPSWVGGRVR